MVLRRHDLRGVRPAPVSPGCPGAHFEDGTANYLNIPAVEIGLRYLDGIGIDAIHVHTAALGTVLLDGLTSLRHADGSPAAPCRMLTPPGRQAAGSSGSPSVTQSWMPPR